MSQKTIDWDRMSFEDLQDIEKDISCAILNKRENASTTNYVTRVRSRRYKAGISKVAPKRLRKNVLDENDGCMMAISLASSNMQGAKLEACIQWISENFNTCELVVADSIYRLTLQAREGVSPGESRSKAPRIGRDFKKEYEPLMAQYRDSCQLRWLPMSEVEKQPEFEDYLDRFRRLYEKDVEFQTRVHEFSDIYLERIVESDGSNVEEKKRCAVEYLIEEAAVFSCLCENGLNVFVYPGSMKIFEDIAEGKLLLTPRAIRKMIFLSLRLNKRNHYYAGSTDSFYPASNRVDPDTLPPKQMQLSNLSGDDWRTLQTFTERMHFNKGDVVIPEGSVHRRMLYILEKGVFEVLQDTSQIHTMRQISVLAPVTIVGEQSFVDGEPQTVTIAALEDCEALILSQKKFQKMMTTQPGLALALLMDVARIISLRQRTYHY